MGRKKSTKNPPSAWIQQGKISEQFRLNQRGLSRCQLGNLPRKQNKEELSPCLTEAVVSPPLCGELGGAGAHHTALL